MLWDNIPSACPLMPRPSSKNARPRCCRPSVDDARRAIGVAGGAPAAGVKAARAARQEAAAPCQRQGRGAQAAEAACGPGMASIPLPARERLVHCRISQERNHLQACALLEEADLGMHAWRPRAPQAPSSSSAQKQRSAETAAARRERLIASFCAKSPVYENCRMLAADGQLLSFIDLRKLQWYEVSDFPF